MKKCTNCQVFKEPTEFYKDKKNKDGLARQCKVCVKERAKAHYRANRESRINRASVWTKNNREKTREYARRHYASHRDTLVIEKRIRSSQWAKDNPDKARMKVALRRARMLAVESQNVAAWLDLLEFYGAVCAKCGATDNLTLDHVVPITLGGGHLTFNFQILCKPCNSQKGNRNSTDYREYPKLIAILE